MTKLEPLTLLVKMAGLLEPLEASNITVQLLKFDLRCTFASHNHLAENQFRSETTVTKKNETTVTTVILTSQDNHLS